jgi:hypothetical protein
VTVPALVLALVACLGWALLLRRRLARAADVEHELRGALTALGLAVQRQRDAGLTAAYDGQLARVRSALGEPQADRCSVERLLRSTVACGPASVVLGNLMANAAEHGAGPAAVRIEVVNRRVQPLVSYGTPNAAQDRGRGLRIAARAARAAGGRLEVRDEGGRFAAVVELPVEP